MVAIYLGLGSNIRPVENLQYAVSKLRSRFGEVTLSSVYRNKAVGFDGEDFLNLVAAAGTELSVSTVCEILKDIQLKSGRRRGSKKFVSRLLDIDLLMYGDLVSERPPLILPRSDILCYSFVLLPLAEIAGDCVHPVSGRSIASHLSEFDLSCHPLTRMDVIL